MWWTADPPRPFQLCPVPICSALRFLVAGLLPAFIYRRLARLSQGTANSYRVTLMVRPLLLAEPGPGDASCTTWTLSVVFHPFYFRAGRPSSKFAFFPSPVFRPLLIIHFHRSFNRFKSSDFLQLFNCFQSIDLLQPTNCFQSSNYFQSYNCFQSSDHLRSFDRFRFSCDPNLSIGRLLSNGGFKLLLKDRFVKGLKVVFRGLF